MLINREIYLNQINGYINAPIIKILTGMRRAGKSCIMKLIIKQLMANKVPERNIIYINMERLDFDFIKNYHYHPTG